MLTRKEIAQRWRISVDTLGQYMKHPAFPPPAKRLGREETYWALDDLKQFERIITDEVDRDAVSAPTEIKTIDYQIGEDIREHIGHRLKGAQRRCKESGMPFEITFSEALLMYDAQGGKCAVSGMAFSMEQMGRSNMRPFAASLDRIDSTKGYVNGNLRLVCQCINMLMNEWGDVVYERVAEHIRANPR